MIRFTPLRAGLAGLALLLAAAPAQAGGPSAAPEPAPAGQAGRNLVGEDVASYVRMEPVSTAIQIGRRSGVRAMLEVTFALDAPSRGARRSIDQRRLWLRAAYSETLLVYAGRMYRWGDVPDADLIARLLQAETDRYLGEGEAQVLLDTVMIHAG
ncbi:MAG: hypothetical protein ABL308_04370 [Oceanicaulis sp.]